MKDNKRIDNEGKLPNAKIYVPIADKYTLSIEEAAEYYGIGEKRLRGIAIEYRNEGFILAIGSHVRFKRRLFEEFLDRATAV